MKLKLSFLSVALMAVAVCAQGQSSRNLLNSRPASVKLHTGTSPKYLVDMTYYHADNSQFDKYSYTYGENGRKSTELFQSWDSENNAWSDVSKYEYIYGDKSMSSVFSSYGVPNWSNSSKTDCIYDADGKKISSLYYNWDRTSEQWAVQASIKSTWTYNESGYMTLFSEQYWNIKTEEWSVPMTQILYTYDETGNLAEELIQRWNTETSKWEDNGKYEYSYNENKSEVVCKSYLSSNGNWILDSKILCFYDEDGDMERCEYYGNEIDEPLNAYCVYTYSETMNQINVVDNEVINVYPNPAVSSFELTVSEALVGEVANIFNIYGKQVQSFVVGKTKTTVSLTGIPAGIYFVKVGNNTEKLVVK